MVIGELEEVQNCVNRNLWVVWKLVVLGVGWVWLVVQFQFFVVVQMQLVQRKIGSNMGGSKDYIQEWLSDNRKMKVVEVEVGGL